MSPRCNKYTCVHVWSIYYAMFKSCFQIKKNNQLIPATQKTQHIAYKYRPGVLRFCYFKLDDDYGSFAT